MKIRRAAWISTGLCFFLFSGCASQVTKSPDQPKPEVRALREIAVEMSPQAVQKVADDVTFEIGVLRGRLQHALASRELIAPDGDFDLRVVIKDVRVRGAAAAVWLGFMAGDDHLIGDAYVVDRNGDTVYTYTAEASYALGGFAGGDNTTRINWLYDKFSEIVSDELVVKRDAKE